MFSLPQIASTVAESLEFQKIWLWQQFSARVTPGVQRIVEFAKRVPVTSVTRLEPKPRLAAVVMGSYCRQTKVREAPAQGLPKLLELSLK